MISPRTCAGMLLVLLAVSGRAEESAPERVYLIRDPLNLDWPWERVHFDVPSGALGTNIVAEVGGERRPAQIQPARRVTDDGTQDVDRVWFMATLARGAPSGSAVVRLRPGSEPSPLRLVRHEGLIEVHNGIYEFLVPDYGEKRYDPPAPLDKLGAPVSGYRLAGGGALCGGSHFRGSRAAVRVATTVEAAGPVFAQIRLSYDFKPDPAEQPAAGASPESPAARGAFYDVVFTFVVGDPWIDVTEAYRVAADAGYELLLSDGLQADTVMWVRWFDWQSFGGNNRMDYAPLRPRPRQEGAFVRLQPVWTQSPGHGQDFFITRGGSPPAGRPGVDRAYAPSAYDPAAPAVGVVATYPTKWVAPYQQKIECHALGGSVARVSLPLRIGTRSYAICIGPRRLFDTTEKLNGLVRRHTDWTLDDEISNYILEWPRLPKSGGPGILIGAERLDALRADYKAGRDTATVAAIRTFESRQTQIGRDEMDILRLVRGEPVVPRPAPTADLWLGTRYQDDFLNPTTFTRRVGRAFPWADLSAGGRPLGGPATAALGYIFSDPDQWPGWLNGWHPGNPNFHTDKYQLAVFAGAAMRDHPHAPLWLEYGKRNFEDDVRRTLLPPDGVGYECPGYSTYSLTLQLEIARVFHNIGYGNPVASNDLFRRSGLWHRHLLTPVDPRIGIRHQAPIGDTHRWGEHDGRLFGFLAAFYREQDPAFASEMMGVWKLFRDQGMEAGLPELVFDTDLEIAPLPPGDMEWGSHAFFGFGTVMRSRFGTPSETFVSFKAGPARGHYHNDELSYHFYGAGMPLALDYNCSYSPRGDHAALHNTMTFGTSGPLTHLGTTEAVETMEQLWGAAALGYFRSLPGADLAVAERTGNSLERRPFYPHDARFGYDYPRRAVTPIVHRRFLMLVKHPGESQLNDYLVVRDETVGAEPQQLHVHLLARELAVSDADPRRLTAKGQWEADAALFLHLPGAAAGAGLSREALRIGCWYYGKGAAAREPVSAAAGAAFVPPDPPPEGGWRDGEYQVWLQVALPPGQAAMHVLYPVWRGDTAPEFSAAGDAVTLALDGERETVSMATAAPAGAPQATVTRGDTTTVVAPAGSFGPPGSFAQAPLPAR